MPGTSLPSHLELQALSVLYAEGPTTVAAVLENLPDRKDRAYTTILSVMQSLERKGLVKATRNGRAYIYKPTKSQASIVSSSSKKFVINAFGGSIGHAILHLLSTGNMTPEEKSAVERELKKHRAMAAKKKTARKTKAATKRKPAKKAAKRKAAKRKPAKKKAAKRKAAKRKPAKKKAAKRKAAKRKPAKKKAAKRKAAKRKPAKKKAAKRKPAKKKAAKRKPAKKKAAKRKAARKRR